jgi:hypothetical protein
MDKSLLTFIAIGVGAIYLLTNFLGDIEDDDTAYQSHTSKQAQKYDQYKRLDSVGQTILVFDASVSPKIQMDVWNASEVKKEFFELFPNYSEMKTFLQERIDSSQFQAKLIKAVDDIEGQFFSGKIDAEKAKQLLGSMK